MINAEYVKKVLRYDQATGSLYWRSPGLGRRLREAAGSINGDGYRQIGIRGRRYMAHRLVWLMLHGCLPSGVIDHINFDRDDNRIENLRDVSVAENCAHRDPANSSGSSKLLGAQWDKQHRCWRSAYKPPGGARVFLGLYATQEEAHEAYMRKKYAGVASCADMQQNSGESPAVA